jgi:hypothetical protein
LNATIQRLGIALSCVLLAAVDAPAQSVRVVMQSTETRPADVMPSPVELPAEQQTFAALPSDSVRSMNGARSEGQGEGEREGRRGAGERERDEIETDRDSFTPATTTAGWRRLIVESAYSFIENRGVKDTHSFPEMVLRYGLTDWLELRLGWNYEVGGEGTDISGPDSGAEALPPERHLERESNVSYGFKFRVTQQQAWVPASAVILQAFTPTSGQANHTQFAGTYVFGWELPRRWKLDAAIRYLLGSGEKHHFNEWAPSVVLKVPLGERVNVHAEYFGLFSTNKAEEINHQYFSPGVHYLITPDLEVGVRVGWGLNEQTPRFFSNVGFGWRF